MGKEPSTYEFALNGRMHHLNKQGETTVRLGEVGDLIGQLHHHNLMGKGCKVEFIDTQLVRVSLLF